MRDELRAAIEGSKIEDKVMDRTADAFMNFMEVALELSKEITARPTQTELEEKFLKAFCEYNVLMMSMMLLK